MDSCDLVFGFIIGFPIGLCLGLLISQALTSPRATASLRNEEEVTWTDWSGRERKMVIHRVVE